MKPTEIKPIDSTAASIRPLSDRLTQLLIWVTFFLVAGLAALVADLWLRPAADGPIVEAAGPTASDVAVVFATQEPTLTSPPTALPTIQATPAVEVAPTQTIPAASPTPVTPPPCVPPDDWGVHVVQEGNTLDSLAQRYGTDVDTLMRVNCLNTFTIFGGQRLYVPGAAAAPFATHPPLPTSTPWPGATSTPRGAMDPMLPTPTPAPTSTPKPALQVDIPDHYLNIVLLGSDKRPVSGAWRTDSMIIVSVDTQNNVVRLLSLPRDLWVYIPDHGYNRINTADLWGELDEPGTGPDWVKQTIHYNLGIPIHYYVRVDFQGFISIVDTVGGIDVDVDCPLADINLTAGIHHMNGKEALRYSRSRKSTNDFDRGRRQRKVLLALWDQTLTLDIIPKLPDLWRTMKDAFATDLSLEQVVNLAYVGVRLKPQHILSRAIGANQVQSWMTPQGAAVLLPVEDRVRALLEKFYAPLDAAGLDGVDKVRVRILNGSPRRDAEELAAAMLRWEGFKVIGTGLADSLDYAQTAILVYDGNIAIGQEVARLLGVPVKAVQDMTGLQQPDPADSVAIQVILGRNYNPCQQ
jgi:LCP family protein required for cell wall assembly